MEMLGTMFWRAAVLEVFLREECFVFWIYDVLEGHVREMFGIFVWAKFWINVLERLPALFGTLVWSDALGVAYTSPTGRYIGLLAGFLICWYGGFMNCIAPVKRVFTGSCLLSSLRNFVIGNFDTGV